MDPAWKFHVVLYWLESIRRAAADSRKGHCHDNDKHSGCTLVVVVIVVVAAIVDCVWYRTECRKTFGQDSTNTAAFNGRQIPFGGHDFLRRKLPR